MGQHYRTGDQALVREINLSTMLRCLQEYAPLSRARLADLTGLNKTTISSLAEELLDRGLVYEVGMDTTKGGRPATLLDLNPKAGHIIGVELGVGLTSVIITDFAGKVIRHRMKEVEPAQTQETIINDALKLVDEAIAANESYGVRLLGLGLSLSGLLDINEGTLIFSPNLKWRNVPLRRIFREHVDLPVMVDNDANAAALGEHLFGVARQVRDFVFLIASVGIGAGLFLNGELYRGAGGFAGEIGHTSMVMDSARPCRCGNRGCWETFSNQYSLIERVRARLEVGRSSIIPQLTDNQNSPLNLSIITQAANAGDVEAVEALAETGEAIGVGVANLINIFNPEMIVIGGAMSIAGEHLLPAVNRAVQERAYADMQRQVKVVFSAFGPDASVMGAVALVVRSILSKPSSVKRLSLQLHS